MGHVLRTRGQDGFTLVEILIVIVIAALLAALALPAFLGQKTKASDAAAKSDARNAETAMHVYRTENGGSYVCGTSAACVGELRRIEGSVPAAGLTVSDDDGTGSATSDAFRVTALGGEARTFWISRNAAGSARGCALNGAPRPGGCRVVGGAPEGDW
jgi:type IV pilus assembly protein PilA